MAEILGESSWKAFTKKQKLALDDAALVKALARLDKTDATRPEPMVQALDEVVDEARKQVLALGRNKALGDKLRNDAKDRLYEVIEAAERRLKEARAALEAAADDDEEDTPVLLTSKMVPLVRELRKGEARMHALIGTAGRNTAVLIMRRPISPARRKLLNEAIDAKGGAKYIVGECLFEDQALTFIVKAPAAGLAKRLKAALLAQTDLRLKVRVRGEDPNDVDEDGEDEGVEHDDAQARQAHAASGASFKARLAALVPRIKAALDAGKGRAEDARLKASEAGVLARKGDFEQANALLDEAEALIEASGDSTAGSARSAPAAASPEGAASDPLVIWQQAKDAVDAQLSALQDTLRKTGVRALVEIADQLDQVTLRFRTSLNIALINLNQAAPAQKAPARIKALKVVNQYQARLGSDEAIAGADENPFGIPVTMRDTLGEALDKIESQLG